MAQTLPVQWQRERLLVQGGSQVQIRAPYVRASLGAIPWTTPRSHAYRVVEA